MDVRGMPVQRARTASLLAAARGVLLPQIAVRPTQVQRPSAGPNTDVVGRVAAALMECDDDPIDRCVGRSTAAAPSRTASRVSDSKSSLPQSGTLGAVPEQPHSAVRSTKRSRSLIADDAHVDTPLLNRLYGRRAVPRLAHTTNAPSATAGANVRAVAVGAVGSNAASFYAGAPASAQRPPPALPPVPLPQPLVRNGSSVLRPTRCADPLYLLPKRLQFAPQFAMTHHDDADDDGLPEPSAEQQTRTISPLPSGPCRDAIARAATQLLYREPAVCAVCDAFVPVATEHLTAVIQPEALTANMRAVLRGADLHPPLPDALRAQYHIHPKLEGVLLSPRSVCSTDPFQFLVCYTCWKHLKNGRLPKFAIANGLAIGTLPPEFAATTAVEASLVTPVQCYAHLIRLQKDQQHQLKGHMSSQRLDVPLVAAKLPLRAADIQIRVLITRAMTSLQRELALRDYAVRSERVDQLLTWLRANNRLYADMEFDAEALHELPRGGVLPEVVHSDARAGDAAADRAPQPTVADAGAGVGAAMGLFGATLQLPVRGDSFQSTAIALRSLQTVNERQVRSYSVRSSSERVWANDKLWFVASHPIQMPFGRGGPDEERPIAISAAMCYRHYARLSTRQFQSATDALYLYDTTARERVSREVFLRARWRTNNSPELSPFGRVSVDDIAAAIQWNEQCVEAQRAGRRAPDLASVSSDAQRFIQSVKVCVHAAEHSIEHSRRARLDLLSMGYALGPATWWLTISPDDRTSLLVYNLATGERPAQVPLASARTKLLADRPGAAALAFERLQSVVIRYVLGWDAERHRPFCHLVPEQATSSCASDEGGLLGVCRAFAIANETQARGSLHMHILVWSERHVDVVAHVRRCMQAGPAQAACQQLADVLETAIQNELSVSPSVSAAMHACPVAGCKGDLQAASDSVLAALRTRNCPADVMPLRCAACGTGQRCSDRIAAVLDAELSAAGSAMRVRDRNAIAQKKWAVQLAGSWNWSNSAERLEIAAMEEQSVTHMMHTDTCWKRAASANTCRHRFPMVSVPHSVCEYDEKADDLLFGVRRRAVFAFISSFNRHVHEICMCNSNLQFVKSHEVAYYMTLYATKVQREEAEANAGLLNSFRQNVARLAAATGAAAAGSASGAAPEVDSTRKFLIGTSQVLSATNGWTSADTVSSQAAAVYNLGGRAFVYSHDFAALPVRQGLAFLNAEQIHGTVTRFGTARASVFDYVFRPADDAFERMCWYRLMAAYTAAPKLRTRRSQASAATANTAVSDEDESSSDDDIRVRVTKGGAKKNAGRERHDFIGGHPQAGKLQLAKRVRRCIVTILLPRRLADLKLLDSGQHEELEQEREKFAAATLVMFRPFRVLSDLKREGESFWQAFQRQRPLIAADTEMYTVMQNMQLLHHHAKVRNMDERPLVQSDAASSMADVTDSETDSDNDADRKPAEEMEDGDAEPLVDRHAPAVQRVLMGMERARLGIVPFRAAEAVTAHAFDQSFEVWNARRNQSKQHFTELVDRMGGSVAGAMAVSNTIPSRVVERVRMAFSQIQFIPPTARRAGRPEAAAVDLPTITAASQHWSLNELQHFAFVLICSAILERVLRRIDAALLSDDTRRELFAAKLRCAAICSAARNHRPAAAAAGAGPGPATDPDAETTVFGFITGAAGTGKSRVIDAALDFARRWAAADIVCVTATSGAAAALISASTWQSAVGVGLEDVPPAVPSTEKRLEWLQRGVLIVDEIGMGGAKTLARLDNRLRQLKSDGANRLFGGVHVVVFGDFQQLRPVGDIPVYQDADEKALARAEANEKAARKEQARAGAQGAIDDDEDAAVQRQSKAERNAKRAVTLRLQAHGHEIWRKYMNAGIELLVNERTGDNKEYADVLARFAANQPTANDLNLINGRVVSPDAPLPANTTVVVPRNDERVAINNKRFHQYCAARPVDAANPGSWRDRGAIIINAAIDVNVKRKPKRKGSAVQTGTQRSRRAPSGADGTAAAVTGPVPRTPQLLSGRTLRYLRSEAFSGIRNGLVHTGSAGQREVTGRLRLIVGAPVMVLNNDQTVSGIVNGTVATVVDVITTGDHVVRFDPSLAAGGGAHCVLATDVKGLVLRYADEFWARQNIFADLPAGCFPLRLPYWRQVHVHLGGAFVPVRVKQFQCTAAFALTGNKVQGSTLSNLLVASWKLPKAVGQTGADGWIYVALSRVRRLASLFTLEQLPGNPKHYKPRDDIIYEMKRLRVHIFEPTLSFLRSCT